MQQPTVLISILTGIGGFLLITLVFSLFGWFWLGRAFAFREKFFGTSFHMVSSRINGLHYKNCMTVYYNEEGICIKPFFLFRLFHTPILIPWNNIQSVEQERRLLLKEVVLVVQSSSRTVITLPGSHYDIIQKYRFNRIA